jgi:biotin carboxylase
MQTKMESWIFVKKKKPYANVGSCDAPTCFLIEINPRPPGFQSLCATRITYGIDYVALHLLACLGKCSHQCIFHREDRFWCQIVMVDTHTKPLVIPGINSPFTNLVSLELMSHSYIVVFYHKTEDI